MVLDAVGAKLRARQPFNRAVVEVAMGQLYTLGQGLLADGKAVVLACDLDTPCPQVADRVVRAVVPERHLVRFAVQSQTEKLMPEADAENRRLPEDASQVRDRLL